MAGAGWGYLSRAYLFGGAFRDVALASVGALCLAWWSVSRQSPPHSQALW